VEPSIVVNLALPTSYLWRVEVKFLGHRTVLLKKKVSKSALHRTIALKQTVPIKMTLVEDACVDQVSVIPLQDCFAWLRQINAGRLSCALSQTGRQ
jgi:hypothetical protein